VRHALKFLPNEQIMKRNSILKGKSLVFKSELFRRHVEKFLRAIDPPQGINKTYIAVSGGVDSMVLLHCLAHSSSREVVVLHVNHGTRPSANREEEEMVKSYAHLLGLECVVKKLALAAHLPNFEMVAREERQKFFQSYHSKEVGTRLALAHHLDDSFEWNLMQSFRSAGKTTSVLGIPCRNGWIVRPLLCVTKSQILKYARVCRVPFLEDESNQNPKHERNYLRQVVAPAIESRYPQYLKYYAARSNFLATELGVSIFPDSSFQFFSCPWTGAAVFWKIETSAGREEVAFGQALQKVIHEKSDGARGSLLMQIKKTVGLAQSEKWGPMTFSGGAKAVAKAQTLAILGSAEWASCQLLDRQLSKVLKSRISSPRFVLSKKIDEVLRQGLTWLGSVGQSKSFTFSRKYELESGRELCFWPVYPYWVLILHQPEKVAEEKKLFKHLSHLHSRYPLWPEMTALIVSLKQDYSLCTLFDLMKYAKTQKYLQHLPPLKLYNFRLEFEKLLTKKKVQNSRRQ
jgi:tRNA(Ile)-lysidine synthase